MSSAADAAEDSMQPSKTCHGPPPPPELINGASSLKLLSQGAEARVWLVTLPDHIISDTDDTDGSGVAKKQRSIHVGSGINVPQLDNFSQRPSPLLLAPSSSSQTLSTSNNNDNNSSPLKRVIICKERFPKKYRHPQLDVSLTKSRTKSEARSLIRCQRANVPCPNVLAIAHWSNNNNNAQRDGEEVETNSSEKSDMNNGDGNNMMMKTSTTSSCLFLECINGCTVRQYFEQRSASPPSILDNKCDDDGNKQEPATKRPRCENDKDTVQKQDRVTTVIDAQTLCVANTIGTLVAKMHAAGVIHGDLTTSNIMLSNPPSSNNHSNGGHTKDSNGDIIDDWKPQLVLIDFGLATSTASTGNNNGNNNNKKPKLNKQQHNAEEKAVDLYVLERAFLSTHPESELLVEEVWKGYREYFDSLDDCQKNGNNDIVAAGDGGKVNNSTAVGASSSDMYGNVAKAVMNRLEQVRMRGRKRECFG